MKKWLWGLLAGILLLLVGASGIMWYQQRQQQQQAERTVRQFTSYFSKQDFVGMVNYIDKRQLKGMDYHYTTKKVVQRSVNVFGQISAKQMNVKNIKLKRQTKQRYQFSYELHLVTALGPLTVRNYRGEVVKRQGKWRVIWTPALLFPKMSGTETIDVVWDQGHRGKILDRKDRPLAEDGQLMQAGMVPQKITEQNLTKISQTFAVSKKTLQQSLKQSWVQPDSFVPVKTLADGAAQPQLAGITYRAVAARKYPSKEASAQLVGYVGQVTAEDLKKHPTLQSGDQIGKTGLERTYNQKLSGHDGGRIAIYDGDQLIRVIQKERKKNGHNLKLTIDRTQQEKAYQSLAGQPGAVVTMAPKTGQLTTLVSSPSYDPNLFANGITQKDYQKYLDNSNNPFLARYLTRYAPGSTFKAVTAGIALDNGTITTNTTRKISGLKWQPNHSWGNYQITRVTNTPEENMAQALINSDNIWFAQTTLAMGQSAFYKGLKPFIFGKKLAIPLTMPTAQVANQQHLSAQLLADSGYGQGQLLMTPIQQAVTYSVFANQGRIQLPTLLSKQSAKKGQQVIKPQNTAAVVQALEQVVSDPAGTAHDLQIDGHQMAAKTGTAELKQQQDIQGKQNGFVFAFDPEQGRYLTVAMMEGKGSEPVVQMIKPYLEDFY
ncbi:penicillin-binding transpeptidase domain-containing protein [Loigolactobacillus backii]|uniref:Cell division protein FtsI n=1 Tax=Loigolactobacillus backii TaxID=375175 RepID=A0A192H1W5_9LACO|nr:penicillin-binding transpeptidase domain-containing protein [Loigolactobacillus backii]ANK61936.1 cell division protein FtsI [Loigolactobacillus backii]ANK65447.1 cell division protein FtsI [Loigolactobacillus backii]ANK68870.1 cell division protein FtsI [Loigolactobacillus backii]MDA5386869.1 penicillin-binding transpeptidase domain-containing protein [Loigolactobacillus backii]MDA5389347.1 penicillin-binding transpeptidase domain-containing protein [Loigolactobacillus backii]